MRLFDELQIVRRVLASAGVIDQDIDLLEPGQSRFDDARDLLPDAHIGFHCLYLTFQLRAGSLKRRLVGVTNDDRCTLSEKFLGDAKPDASGTAGHDRDLAFEVRHFAAPYFLPMPIERKILPDSSYFSYSTFLRASLSTGAVLVRNCLLTS